MKIPVEHGGNVWSISRRLGKSPAEILDFSANLNPLGPPPAVMKLFSQTRKIIRYASFYPEPRAQSLRLAVAQKFGLAPGEVIIGNGASELISLFFSVLRPRKVLLPAPTYGDYARAAHAARCKVENLFFEADDFVSPLEVMAREITRRQPEAFAFCNPNNPTGTFWEDIAPLFGAREKTFLLLDISFLPFTRVDGLTWLKQNNLLPFRKGTTGKAPVFFVLSLTKVFALPGLRLGIGFGPPSFIEKMEAARDPWSVNALAQAAGLQCLEERAYLVKSFELIRREREYLYRSLKKLGLKPFPSQANFLLMDSRQTGLRAAEIAYALAERGCLIRNADNFPGLDKFYLRAAVKKRRENHTLLQMLKEVINTRGNGGNPDSPGP